MDEYKRVIDLEIKKAKNKFKKPKSKGTLQGMSEYLEYYEKILTYTNKQLVKVGNEYAKGKEFSDSDINKMQKINFEAANKLVKELKP
ncbi:hypothetical protein JM84_1571 [Dokdonia sp. Hel_I_63]|uniref:hypothetical protein n=1 Tax=Dokdonia sp. Hel_I_63 TaxID=1249996 RepID=UPI001199CDDB|nr:hypothetical protein [Dokdonia sp. Hel_I_63]TVZ22663.1 hypothetical protein JM84_1571 [Dokdonia sp. Hel_I_63]